MLLLGIRLSQTKHLQIAVLKYEGKGFREGRVRDALQQGMVHTIKRKNLFDAVAQFMHGDVKTFIIHPAANHPRTQMGVVAPPPRTHGMPGAARRIHFNFG